MARRANSRSGRVVSTLRHTPPPRVLRFSPLPLSLLLSVEDRRTYHPEGRVRPAFSLFRRSARIVARQNPRHWQPSQTKAILAFADPARVPICVRRERRRRVLHAFRIAGRRPGGFRRRRRNAHSNISCR